MISFSLFFHFLHPTNILTLLLPTSFHPVSLLHPLIHSFAPSNLILTDTLMSGLIHFHVV